jgi:propionyl-CoA synthetase
MEAAVASHPAIAECAVIAVPDSLKGHVPVAFVVLKNGVAISQESLAKDVVQIVLSLAPTSFVPTLLLGRPCL